jgi:hypothetical protein
MALSLPRPPGPGRYKCKFTSVEDAHLIDVVARCGTSDWSLVATFMYHRTARQCRERWNNYVNPALENVPWTHEEDELLDEKYNEYGTKWQAITVFFPTRSRNDIKCHWFQRQRRLDRIAASQKPRPPLPEGPRQEGVAISQFSLSEMVPIPIVPRGHPCHN